MFQYQYPQFQFKALLREEMLELLRDYPKTYLQLCFDGFRDGIVTGCGLSWEDGMLTVHPGIVYRGGNLYFMEKPYSLECRPDNQKRYVKLRYLEEESALGKVVGATRIILEHEEPDFSCEMELCRFCLQDGAKLRDRYESFADFSTEYDTINLIHVPFAGEGECTLNPRILRQFARETFKNQVNNPYDVSFAMNIMANRGIISAECILAYLEVQLDGAIKDRSGRGMYMGLLKVLREQEHGERGKREAYENRKGVMLL